MTITLELFLAGCSIILAGGLLTALLGGRYSFLAVIAVWLGSILAAIPVFGTLVGNVPEPLMYNWWPGGGSLTYSMDALSAFFCLPIILISPLAAVYGRTYLHGLSTGSHWLFYNLLNASMLMLIVCGNAVMFLIIWEVMALSSFFLVMFDHRSQTVREAGWTYLVATHIGTAALLFMFAWLGSLAGSMDFSALSAVNPAALPATVMFLLALVGFGVKAGFIPLHVWLPEAHPAAPSHVSALMSGVMIKTGIYGLLRVIALLGNPLPLWGWILLLVGIGSGIVGAANTVVQKDIKRLLAYCSVENIGIIATGLGAGLLGLSWRNPAITLLGFGGALLHVLNHAVFKSLLFMGAGSVAHAAGTRDLDKMGGLLRRMPVTGACFLVGSIAISGLPPLNGFISEYCLYLAGMDGIKSGLPGPILLAAAILTGLALMGGLAVAGFTRAFGFSFLGEPRSESVKNSHESHASMLWPMIVLAVLCLLLALASPLLLQLINPVILCFSGANNVDLPLAAGYATVVLTQVVMIFVLLILAVGLFYTIRRNLPRGRAEVLTGTWDCGYAQPTPRMQYTASSFAQPLGDLFATITGISVTKKTISGYFPAFASLKTVTIDIFKQKVYAPVFKAVARLVAPIRQIQHGKLHGYLLYIALTLIVLLVFKVGF